MLGIHDGHPNILHAIVECISRLDEFINLNVLQILPDDCFGYFPDYRQISTLSGPHAESKLSEVGSS